MKILFLAAEVAPLAKVGGLADVAGALPKSLAGLGVDIRLCLPFYGSIDKKKYKAKKLFSSINLEIGGRQKKFSLWQTNLPGTKIPVYLIKHPYFGSDDIYLGCRKMSGSRYEDDANDIVRFSFFSQAVVEAVKRLRFCPDIIHANDWHTSLVFQLTKNPDNKKFFYSTRSVFTIHNLANQGIFKDDIVKLAEIDQKSPIVAADLKNGDLNLMVQGILGADAVTTVSPTYAQEIIGKKMGAGLSKVLRMRSDRLSGITNGIDTDMFNPATDPMIIENYSLKTLHKKTANKIALQKKLGLPQNEWMPLAGLVARFVWQKGTDLINDNFAKLRCQFVFLGTGDKKYEDQLVALEKKYPDRFRAHIGFDAKLAQEIYAGADILLVPSRFEPCGLTQLVAMRYGTVPVVRSTGGLKDTVDAQTGFSFQEFRSFSFYKTLSKAIKTYSDRERWQRLQTAGMKKDFSWDNSAKKYLSLYKKLIRS